MSRRWALVVLASVVLAACRSGAPAASPTATTSPTPVPTGSAPATAAPRAATPGADATAVGTAFIQALVRSDWSGAQAMEDATMAAAAPAAALEQIAAQLVAQYGAYQSIGTASATPQSGGTVVAVPVTFASATVTLNVAVSDAGRVAGLHVGAVVASGDAAKPAAYVDPGSFTETPVTVGTAPWTLPGTLTMPNGPGPFPAVVLVQGSGPADRDETFGVNKPFRDLAQGLASQGIAVLRYDKRTLVYAQQMASQFATTITVHEETMDDAEAAVALLRTTPKVDPARVYLVGHSLGAYLAPRIAAAIPGQLAGLGMLETASSSLPQLILAQTQYLASLQGGTPTPAIAQQLEAIRKAVAVAESPDLSASTPASELPLDTPASYWLDLRAYDPLKTAERLSLPMFFSQGGRDYQVPPSELAPWRQALAGRANVTFKTYASMNHLLMDGSGTPSPAEYSTAGHVDAQLVADLGAWIRGQ